MFISCRTSNKQALYKQFHLDEPWDSEHNKQLIPLMPALFLDPSSRLSPADGKTHYVGVMGEGRLFDGSAEGRKIEDHHRRDVKYHRLRPNRRRRSSHLDEARRTGNPMTTTS